MARLYVLTNLPEKQWRSYPALIQALQRRFSTGYQAELNQAKLGVRVWQKDETLPALAENVEWLTQLAYPSAFALSQDVWVADIVVECLLGLIKLDFLVDQECQVDLKNCILYLSEEEVPLTKPMVSAESRCLCAVTTCSVSAIALSLPATIARHLCLHLLTDWRRTGPTKVTVLFNSSTQHPTTGELSPSNRFEKDWFHICIFICSLIGEGRVLTRKGLVYIPCSCITPNTALSNR